VFGVRPILLGIENKDLGEMGLLVIKLLRALAAPLILFAILDAFARTRIQAKAGARLVFICLVNVLVAMVIGLTILNVLRPGEQWRGRLDQMKSAVHAQTQTSKPSDDPDAPRSATLSIKENIKYYVPSSLIKPLVYNNIISIVLAGLLGGAALRRVKDKQAEHGHDSILTVERFVEGSTRYWFRCWNGLSRRCRSRSLVWWRKRLAARGWVSSVCWRYSWVRAFWASRSIRSSTIRQSPGYGVGRRPGNFSGSAARLLSPVSHEQQPGDCASDSQVPAANGYFRSVGASRSLHRHKPEQ